MRTPNQIQKLAVGPAEAAQIAGIGRTKLYEIIGSGELKSFRIGSRRLIRISEIERWLMAIEDGDDHGE